MTKTLLTQLRELHTRSTDDGDRAILGAIITADEAAKAETVADEMKGCNLCPETWPAKMLSDDGDCPNCLVEKMHEIRARRRAHFIGMVKL